MPFSTTLKSVIQLLQGRGDPVSAAAGVALGATLGLVPKGNLLAAVFFLLFFLFRLDKGLALASAALFTAVGYAVDPLAHRLGLALLTAGWLEPLWTWLYNLPVVPWTRFNNTVVLGNLAIGLLLFAPLYVLSRRLIALYQERWRERVARLPVVRSLQGMRFFQMYREWFG